MIINPFKYQKIKLLPTFSQSEQCISHSLLGHRRPSPLLWYVGPLDGISRLYPAEHGEGGR